MALISISHLTFCYDGSYDNIFENVSLSLDTNWRLGLIGRNGRGKTTLLKLLMGKEEYRGAISSPVEFEYFPDDSINETLPVLELMHILSDAEDWEIERELSLLSVSDSVLSRPYGTLSGGEKTKVQIAGMFLRENRFLLIDEPTNHLDAEGREILGEYLRRKKGFILVSHDRDFLDRAVDHILSINKGDIELQKGNFSSWKENRDRLDQYEQRENERLAGDISRLETAVKRTAGWSDKVEKGKYHSDNSGISVDRGYVGHQSAKMMKRAKAIENRRQTALDEKKKLLKNVERQEELKIHILPYRKKELLYGKDLTLYYGDRAVAGPLSFSLSQGEQVALCGKNGSGKSTLLHRILGDPIRYTGALSLPSDLKISFVSQDTSFLKGNLSDYARQEEIDESLFKTILRKFGFERVQFEKNMEEFSGGQKKKVLLARSLSEQANLYLWDEPLNFVDIVSRMQIEELLLQWKPTILFVEHDRAFQNAVASRFLFKKKKKN